MVDALREAHAKEIVHRDLKPGNLIINSTHELKVLHFGLAMALKAGMSGVTVPLPDVKVRDSC
jgi:eukaryotic-like serine/threonine-protein kinase